MPLQLPLLPSRHHYPELLRWLDELSQTSHADHREAMRLLIRQDLFFLLRYCLHRPDLEHDWLFERCRDVGASPDGHLDLWARGHYKSTIITFAKTIQDILASHGENPLPEWDGLQPTFGIFSHTRPIAKAFLRQIMWALEGSLVLHECFPDVLYAYPKRNAPKWSENDGIVLKRASTPKEATVEAWGLVDGQPTSKHFNVLIYDDPVTQHNVTNPDMMKKTQSAYELSLNLGDRRPRKRMIGTRYHFADLYGQALKQKSYTPRMHPATRDGTLTGEPVFLSRAELEEKIRDMGPYTAASQLMQNPLADSKQSFSREWLRHYRRGSVGTAREMWRMLICDPANEKHKHSDWTAIGVLGAGPDRNLYLLDYLRDRLNLTERASAYLAMHRRWQPQFSGYEKYGKDADISYIRERQDQENYRFEIRELGGTLSKFERVNRLIPWFSDHRFYLPDVLHYTDYEGKVLDLVEQFTNEEFAAWPVPLHDDGLDMMSRALDEGVIVWPKGAGEQDGEKRDRYKSGGRRSAWSN